jgi:hypothetical protein
MLQADQLPFLDRFERDRLSVHIGLDLLSRPGLQELLYQSASRGCYAGIGPLSQGSAVDAAKV